ncbi:MAG TPA: hypothetical protein VLS49_03785 [Usitatibacter sp.]|nr:hypothetical protein [Usitatibacter sp.]
MSAPLPAPEEIRQVLAVLGLEGAAEVGARAAYDAVRADLNAAATRLEAESNRLARLGCDANATDHAARAQALRAFAARLGSAP